MKTLTLIRGLALTTFTLAVGSSVYAASPAQAGTVQITVLDENGAVVQEAPVYIYGEHKTRFVGGQEIPGSTTLSLQAGEYKISSALVRKSGDYVDRFASHEAHVRVVEGDNLSLILTLRPIQDATSTMAYAEIQKIGVPSEIARNFN